MAAPTNSRALGVSLAATLDPRVLGLAATSDLRIIFIILIIIPIVIFIIQIIVFLILITTLNLVNSSLSGFGCNTRLKSFRFLLNTKFKSFGSSSNVEPKSLGSGRIPKSLVSGLQTQ
jgi:hypothetical protein